MNRRVHVPQAGRVEVLAAPEPGPPGAGEVLLHPELAGICGSDLHVLSGRHPFVVPPFAPGHEVVGSVAATGAGVDALPVGTRVLLNPLVTCGTCAACREGRPMRCTAGTVIGFGRPGAMAESVVLDARQLVGVPEGLATEVAVLAEPLASVVRALDLAGPAERVLVLGGGTIGLLAALWARRTGAATVDVSELVDVRRALAADLGIVAHPPDQLPHDPVDVVLDCVAAAQTVAQAIERVRPGGTVVVVGVPGGETAVPLADLQRREVVLRGSALYGRAELRRALDALSAGLPGVDALLGTVHPLTDATRAFAEAGRPASRKTLISFC